MGQRGALTYTELVELRAQLLELGDAAIDNRNWMSARDLVRMLREVATDLDNALYLAQLRYPGGSIR